MDDTLKRLVRQFNDLSGAANLANLMKLRLSCRETLGGAIL